MSLPSPALLAVFVLVSVVTLPSVGLARAAEVCPTNTIICLGTHTSTAPGLKISCREFSTGNQGGASYDLIAGRFVSGASTDQFQSGFGTSVLAQDIYSIEGTEAGLTVNFIVSLSISASTNRLGTACALLSEGAENQAVFCAETGGFETKISIPLEHVGGEPFPLLYQLSTSGIEGGFGSITAVLEFEGLPPGATITSCQGFIQDFPVQVRQESWGRIKAMYR